MKMKKTICRIMCPILMLALIFQFGIFSTASASDTASQENKITVTSSEHGKIDVTYDNEKTYITLTPDEKYMTASVTLTNAFGVKIHLTKVEPNSYTCRIPKTKSKLEVEFRRVRVTLSKTELALSKGRSARVKASFQYLDGYTDTRSLIKNPLVDKTVTFNSSNPEVASIDQSGRITALKRGFTRITVTPNAGNGIEDILYVIVDGNESPAVGTLTLFGSFSNDEIEDGELGHGFLVYENTTKRKIKIRTEGMYEANYPTKKYYKTVKKWDGTGYDPVTYFSVTNGEKFSDENEEELKARTELTNSLFTHCDTGCVPKYSTVFPGEIASIGNTSRVVGGDTYIKDMLLSDTSDFSEILKRYNSTSKLAKIVKLYEKLTGKEITYSEFIVDLESLGDIGKELVYDLKHGFNPVDGLTTGGPALNWERSVQALDHHFKSNAACQVKITKTQLEAIMDYAYYNHGIFSFYGYNCSAFATDAWNIATAYNSKFHVDPNLGGITRSISAPFWIKSNIKKMAKSDKLKTERKSGEIRFFIENKPVIKTGMFDTE